MSDIPSVAKEAVLVPAEPLSPEQFTKVEGYDFSKGVDYHKLLQSYATSGFQATHFGKAVNTINSMLFTLGRLNRLPPKEKVVPPIELRVYPDFDDLDKKLEPLLKDVLEEPNLNPVGRTKTNCTIFLSYTSNMISSGIRNTIRYLAEYNMIDCIVTSAGGVEEDFIKCLAPTYIGDFKLNGKTLRKSGINRIGNLLVSNDNYCKFEDWLMPILDDLVREQNEEKVLWTPSKIIHRLGKEIDNPESVYYWTYKNNIPVFCPALTDGSLGDMIYFHSYKNPGLIIDIVDDIRRMNSQAVYAQNSGMIILGGGVSKHHTCNANLMRNGADYCVYLNSGTEYDGSDSGASPDEAISWGKIKMDSSPVKINADATLIFPLLVAETFAKRHDEFLAKKNL